MNELYKYAHLYVHDFKFSVIPLKKDKKPYIKWEEFQTRKPTDKEIESWFKNDKDKMIGIVTGKISNLSVIDVDNEDGDRLFREIVPEGFIAPTVRTPRGGYHVYCKYEEGLRNASQIGGGIDIRSDGGYVVSPPSRSALAKSYTFIVNLETKRPCVPKELLDYKELAEEITENPKGTMFIEGRRDNDLFHVSNCLVKGGMETEAIKQILTTLADSCDPPFPEKEVNYKIKSALNRALRRERNLVQEVKEWVQSSSGTFLSSEVARCLQLTTRDELKSLSKILSRMVESGDIRRHGDRAGMFRKIEKEFRLMNWQDASIRPLDITYPLGLHELFYTYSKNIIVFSGVKDSGKSACLIDFIKRNQNKWKINYFTNEMGDEELKIRLIAHKDIKPQDWKFNAYEIGSNWDDIVSPNDITVIDYIEINENFWEVGNILKNIHERLDKGIAVVGLQKSWGADLGRGKEFSLQRPRMYVTLDSGMAKIVSAKNRIPGKGNPIGLVRRYDIIDGWKIRTGSDWYYPEGR